MNSAPLRSPGVARRYLQCRVRPVVPVPSR
ncbi:hypothetical protein SAMN04487782_1015 [Stenotrophomonas maltophilia]|nr:hypothetical protein SAMN04487782_1015 [Stenotrophomonas maltophilia]